ncbi:MAG: hypothetical protein H0V07_03860 [Propionibacteriales bacterium]|nr:hypothetical protein [Propionibacteriales bacterium]
MADPRAKGSWSSTARVLPRLDVYLLISAVVLVALLASSILYHDLGTFRDSVADGLLQVAVVGLGGALVGRLLKVAERYRDTRAQIRAKREDLLGRMRIAHVRVANAQRLLRADRNTLPRQMRAILRSVRDFEEIREDVKTSADIYQADDKVLIVQGINHLLEYLDSGLRQFETGRFNKRWIRLEQPHKDWLSGFTEYRQESGRVSDPVSDCYVPPGRMHPKYEHGLDLSKGTMRRYVYGSSRDTPASRLA